MISVRSSLPLRQTAQGCRQLASAQPLQQVGPPPPPPLAYPSSLQFGLRPLKSAPWCAAQPNDRHRCTDECESDFDCADDEKCCMVGCMVCAKAQLGPRYTETGIAFVFFLLWAWFITCGLLGST